MITSSDNKNVKYVAKLLTKAKERRNEDVYIVEGPRMFSEAPSEDIVKVFVSEDYKGDTGRLTSLGDDIVEYVSGDVFRKMTDTLTPQGILCIMKQKHYDLKEILPALPEKPIIMLLENLQDPGNLGTIMRTAEGAGVSLVLMSKDTVDLYNPKTVRSTMGSIYRVPFIYTDDIKGSIEQIKKLGIPCFAAHLKGKRAYYEADYSNGACFFIGNEGNGLTDETAGLADEYLIIPMEGKLESLNAAVSAALFMYKAKEG